MPLAGEEVFEVGEDVFGVGDGVAVGLAVFVLDLGHGGFNVRFVQVFKHIKARHQRKRIVFVGQRLVFQNSQPLSLPRDSTGYGNDQLCFSQQGGNSRNRSKENGSHC